jgi:adenylylsulfate kinase
MIYWFTGQPGAGKTTLAKHLVAFLTNTTKVLHIDGDDLRDIFKNKDYSEAGRRKNIERAQDIALFMNEKGHDVVVSLVSPYRDQREEFKDKSEAVEIYVHTTEERGRENFHVTDYEKPEENYVDVDTTNVSDVESFIDLIKRIDL